MGSVRVMGFFYMKKVAILVDGGFYRKQALFHFGEKTPIVYNKVRNLGDKKSH